MGPKGGPVPLTPQIGDPLAYAKRYLSFSFPAKSIPYRSVQNTRNSFHDGRVCAMLCGMNESNALLLVAIATVLNSTSLLLLWLHVLHV